MKKDYFQYCDAFIILTRQGVVLTSDDARLTFDEDNYLSELNHRLMERREEQYDKENKNKNMQRKRFSHD